MFARYAALYESRFLAPENNPIVASSLDWCELEGRGLTITPMADRLALLDELTPSEFDSRAEYDSARARLVSKAPGLTVVAPDTLLFEVVNDKGEGVGYCTAQEAETLPLFVSKPESYRVCGL